MFLISQINTVLIDLPRVLYGSWLLRCELCLTKAYAAQIMIMFDYIIRVQIKEIAIHSCGTTLNLNFGVSFQF